MEGIMSFIQSYSTYLEVGEVFDMIGDKLALADLLVFFKKNLNGLHRNRHMNSILKNILVGEKYQVSQKKTSLCSNLFINVGILGSRTSLRFRGGASLHYRGYYVSEMSQATFPCLFRQNAIRRCTPFILRLV